MFMNGKVCVQKRDFTAGKLEEKGRQQVNLYNAVGFCRLSKTLAKFPAFIFCMNELYSRVGQADLSTRTNPQNLQISYMNRLDTKKSNIKGRNHPHIGLISLLL